MKISVQAAAGFQNGPDMDFLEGGDEGGVSEGGGRGGIQVEADGAGEDEWVLGDGG